jgi:multidrug efflux pump subunit AcrB
MAIAFSRCESARQTTLIMLKNLLTNHALVNILFAVVVSLGAMSYFSMPREQDPEINFNWVNINTILPGASAEDVEQLVTGPLEDAVRNVQDAGSSAPRGKAPPTSWCVSAI